MKSLPKYAIVYLLIVIFFSCKKDKPQPANESIVGNWRWIKTYCDCPTPPKTPDSVGYQYIFTFNSDLTWKRVQANATIDSGTYQTGHESYTNYSPGGTTFSYDLVTFYRNNVSVGWDSYIVTNDTLVFGPGISGRFSSYLLPSNGSIWLVKMN